MLEEVRGVFATERKKCDLSKAETKNDIWESVITALVDPTAGMTEEESAAYLNKIMSKLKAGKDLSTEELNYLKLHDSGLYHTALRVKQKKELIKNKLQHCKSKTEVESVIESQMGGVSQEDGDKEYLVAAMSDAIKEFKKTPHYNRLPEVEEEKGTKKQGILNFLFDDEDDNQSDKKKKVTPIQELLDELPALDVKG